jgi:hypothetical protein
MIPKFLSEERDWNGAVAAARNHALGYGNKLGGVVTPLNVPSSTFTALWRPGFYDPTGEYLSPDSRVAPWVPLFIRASQFSKVVLY